MQSNLTSTLPRFAQLVRLAHELVEDESGGSHLEYALIAFGLGTLLLSGLVVLSGGLDSFYSNTAQILSNLL